MTANGEVVIYVVDDRCGVQLVFVRVHDSCGRYDRMAAEAQRSDGGYPGD